MFLSVSHLSIRYPGADHLAVDGVSFGLAAGEIGVLIGPSGCGKTTLLRAVAGLERATSGKIALQGETVSGDSTHVPPEQRRIGMVFQDYALFPHLNVERNVAFGIKHLDAKARLARVREVLALVGLDGMQGRYPHELSGGQQQRVALARALAPNPRLMLLDEPFSNLDVDLRERLAHEIRAILKAAGATALFVTHDQLEAFAIGDVIGVMHQATCTSGTAPTRSTTGLPRASWRNSLGTACLPRRRLHTMVTRWWYRRRWAPCKTWRSARCPAPTRRACATYCCAPTTSSTTTTPQ